MDIKQEISEIMSKKVSDSDKLWQLMRLIQRFPEFVWSVLDNKISEANQSLKTEIDKEINNKTQEIKKEIPDLNKVLESIKGKDGGKGEVGIKGDRGEKGQKGDDGRDGKDGLLGKQGERGLMGVQGEKGTKGEIGKTGKDGSPDKPEDIAKKLNTLANVLKISLIAGLEERLNKIAWGARGKVVSKGGGGMGDWVHQSFNVNSSTTAITVSADIAGNGFALLAFYQGQNIFRGTHYTQSGRVLTLLFTPTDNTVIDVTFVR